jgi:hypothetical protein
MMQLARAALGAAAAASVYSIADAAVRATSDTTPVWDPEGGSTWAVVAAGLLLSVTFVLLAAVLSSAASPIDEGSGARRWVRRALVLDLVVLAVGGILSSIVGAEFLGAVAGIAFLAMFLLGTILGAMLLRRSHLRVPAVLMVATLPVLVLSFLLGAVAPEWAHPAYAETVLYIGIALLGTTIAARTGAVRSPDPATTGR